MKLAVNIIFHQFRIHHVFVKGRSEGISDLKQSFTTLQNRNWQNLK